MLKLFKYFKPFTFSIIMALVLLFAQAMCDLSLPDYMSHIVNVGIQQGGIENSVPKAIRESEMDKILTFLDEKRESVTKNYTLVDKTDADYEKYLEEYPTLKNEDIYLLNEDVNSDVIDEISPDMGRAILVSTYMDKTGGNKSSLDEINKKITSLGEDGINVAATMAIKEEYKALGVNTDKIQTSYIISIGLKMLLISLVGAVCTIGVGFLASKSAAGMSKNMRKDIFSKVESFSSDEFDKFSTASLITRTTNDVTQIQTVLVMSIRMLIYAPIMGVGGVIKAIHKSPSMSWIIALAVVVLISLIGSIFAVSVPKFKAVQKLVDKLNLVTRENLAGMMVIRAFNTQKFEEKRFDNANKELTDTNLFVNRIMVTIFPAMMFIMNAVTLLIVWVGANKIAESSMQVGDMMAFMQYAMQILFSFLMMSFMFIMIPKAAVSAQRISEVLDVKTTILDPKDPKHFSGKTKGLVEFKNVCFKYNGASEDVLSHISFEAMPGETTAIIGSTGAGKSTLINLIPRFYDVTNGEILIDGMDIRDVSQYELRERIGYVPQKASLFKGTIESNLRYADKNVTDDEINNVCEIAQASEFINEKEEGIKSEISQGGSNVSGGQKQRLSIARALIKKAPIYIFDDSFSALDFKTDAKLRKELKNKTGMSTLIIVAQRISTIINAENIIVLDEGKIVGMGRHDELMKNCETYKEIALSQLSEGELKQ